MSLIANEAVSDYNAILFYPRAEFHLTSKWKSVLPPSLSKTEFCYFCDVRFKSGDVQ